MTKSLNDSSKLSLAAVDCIERYGVAKNFLLVFNPSNQYSYARYPERCIGGKAPTLMAAAEAYGNNVIESWLSIQLKDLSEYAGCKDKLTLDQIDQITKTICSQYGYLKVSELMYFFVLFKSGEFGRFYGAVDGLAITDALRAYKRKKYTIEAKLERDRRDKARKEEYERHQQEVITHAEWQELKWMFNYGYDKKHVEQAKQERERRNQLHKQS